MESSPLLEARHIGRRAARGGSWLLRGVDFQLVAGQRVALYGPSGSGKTLLLRTLAWLDPLDEGNVFWRGERLHGSRLPAYRRQAIYLHQRATLFEGTVYQNLLKPYQLKSNAGLNFSRERILGWLRQLGRSAELLDKRASDLSGGETQLVALLRAIQLDPQVLLLDEPTAALDPQVTGAVEQLVDLWYQTQAESRALVWVSHNRDQSRRVAQRAVAMDAGVLSEAN